jgi:methionyl-tRNA formyltransferase
MRIAFLGTPSAAIPTLERLAETHEIARVVTRPDRRAPRGKGMRPSPVGSAAEGLGLETLKPANKGELLSISFSDVDLAVVVAFGMIIPEEMLSQPTFGFLNLHFSLLPRWRGAAPVQRAMLAGDPDQGVSVMEMDAGLDTGPIYSQVQIPIGGLSAGEATAVFATVGSAEVSTVIQQLAEGTAVAQPQVGKSTYAAKIGSADAVLSIEMNVAEFIRTVHAFDPKPGATLQNDEGGVKVFGARQWEPDVPILPGEMLSHRRGILLGVTDGCVLIAEVQAPGRTRMSAAEWARGRQESLGARQWR